MFKKIISTLKGLFKGNKFPLKNNFAKWDKLKEIDKSNIYAYQLDDGGIYKTMELSLIGNCDAEKHVFAQHKYYYGFVRIDNQCAYCQFMFHSLDDLFKHHFSGNHKKYEICEFTTQKEFFEWCVSRPTQYEKFTDYSNHIIN